DPGLPAPTCGEIEREIETIAALKILLGVLLLQHVDRVGSKQAEHRDERRDRGAVSAGDQLLVGRERRALVQGNPMRAEQQLGRARAGRARDACRNSSVTTRAPPASRASRWWPQESQKAFMAWPCRQA